MIPIGITRIAVRSPLGNSLDETAGALRRGEVGIRTPADLEQVPKVDSGAGEVPLPASDRGAWRAEILLRKTLDDLLSTEDRASIAERPARWGIVVGTTLAGMRHCGIGMRADEAERLADAEESYARACASSVLAHATRALGIEGPTLTVSCACASALSAVSHACTLLESGDVDAVIAGGYDPIAEFVYGGFASLQLVAAGPLSPFAKDREGMKLGEGAAFFVLRRLGDVPADGKRALRAVITDAAESSDAHHLTQPHPDGRGAARALASVKREGRVPDLLVAHATGTPGNDGAEHAAYLAAFAEEIRDVPVVALKSRFGHPLGAAGVLELASVLACAEQGFIPTTAGRGRDTDAFPTLDLLEGRPRAGSPEEIIVLSAGFGGANAAMRVIRGAAMPAATPAAIPAGFALTIRAMGAVSPAGRGVDALRARMADPAPWPQFDENTLTPLLDRARSRRLALLPRLMVGAVRDLTDRAGLTAEDLRDTPLLAASWCGATDFTERYYRDLVRSGIDLANPMLFAESVPNIGSAQCSLAFGITAPTLSAIGRRTAALEALLLARARIAVGSWHRAIIVAAEEAHPVVERTLRRCATRQVQLRSSAIAFLVERADPARDATFPAIHDVIGRTAPLDPRRAALLVRDAIAARGHGAAQFTLSDAAFDDDAFPVFSPAIRAGNAEFGAATPMAGMLAAAPGSTAWIACSDPHGACWAMHASAAPAAFTQRAAVC